MRKIYLSLLVIVAFNTITKAQTINANTFGMMDARALGPGTMSGRITAIEGVHTDPKIIYIGTAGGGIWKTTNAGMSFKSVFDKYCQSIGSIAIDPKNPKIIYAGTGESNMRNSVSIGDGFYKSTDAGDNWQKIGGLDSTEHIARVIIDPSNANIIYVAAPGPLWSDSKHRGLYKSMDGGKTFEKILYVNEKAGIAEVALDPENPLTLYASAWEVRRYPYSFNSGGNGSGMYKSTDGGKTWKELTNGLPAKPFGRIAFTIAPSSPKNIVAIVESGKTGLYISSDGGETWKAQSAVQNIVARPFYFSTLAFDPKDAKRLYRPAYSFSYSEDGGYSFSDASGEGDYPHADMHALWINPQNTNIMYVGTDGGVYMSINKGVNWKFLDQLPVGQFYHVAVDNKKPYYRVYGGLQDNNSWVAPSSYPGGVSNSEWKAVFGGDGFWTVPDPNDENIVYAEAQGGTMYRINTETLKNYSIQPKQSKEEEKLRWNWNTPIVVGTKNTKNLYVGAQYLYKSTNQGRDWVRISPDLTTNDKKKQEQDNSGGLSADVTSAENHCTIFTIAESSFDENIIWVGTDDGNLQYTTDGGKTWKNVAANVAKAGVAAQSWVSSIELSKFDKQTIFATFENHMYGDHATYAAVSRDMGETWTLFKSAEFTGFAHKIKQDIVNKNLLFLGTEMGLFASVDAGNSWFRMKNGMPWYNLVRDMQIHPETNDLIIGTHGRGIYIIDDIAPLRTITPEFAKKEVYLFPQPDLAIKGGDLGYYSASKIGYNAGNAPGVVFIQYYLRDRLASGDVKIEILDKEGKLVQSLPAQSKRRGVNKAYWDMRGLPPKVASGGAKIDRAAVLGPLVETGTYTIKLSVADKTFTTPVNVVNDDKNTEITPAVRKVIHENTRKLFSLHERLAVVANDVLQKRIFLDSAVAKAKNEKNKKLFGNYSTQLESLRATLLGTKQTSEFADEKKLREEISELYFQICFIETAPSALLLKSIELLDEKVTDAEKKRTSLITEADLKLNAALIKEGILKK